MRLTGLQGSPTGVRQSFNIFSERTSYVIDCIKGDYVNPSDIGKLSIAMLQYVKWLLFYRFLKLNVMRVQSTTAETISQ